jgi:hypothetical protein
MLTIIDGNNFFRRLIEFGGGDARSILNEFHQPRRETIVVWDGLRGSQRRRNVYPQYKTNRGPLDKDISVQFNMIVRVLAHCNVTQLYHPDYEGDDVVAMLARDYARKGRQVFIESTDQDYLQIVGEYPKLVTASANPKVQPQLTKLYKIWVGDQSDKITGVPGFGQKTWDEIDIAALGRMTRKAILTGEIEDIGLPSRCKPTAELLRILDEIISFYPVPIDEVMKHIVLGSPNYQAADAYLKEFFL